MSNPTNKFTKDMFVEKFNEVNGNIGITLELDEYTGVDYQIPIRCKHGSQSVLGWQLLKPRKYCCRKGYYENGAGQTKKKSCEKWRNELTIIFKDLYDFADLRKVAGKEKLIFKCTSHGEVEQWNSSLKKGNGCPVCIKEKEYNRKQIQAKQNFIKSGAYLKGRTNISKAETKWLNELNVPQRQHLITETGQTVDGFDSDTNTVYLYHGRYWHGCPETYDPEDVHPSIGVKMKQLYNETLEYEQKIKDAGYELIVKWG